MNKTKIDWCSASLNPVVGCTYGCPFCYAKKMNDRFQWIEDFSKPEFFPDRLKSLYSKKPQIIFMDSMSDIADWKEEWVDRVFDTIRKNPQHKYLFLSKRLSTFFDNNENSLLGEIIEDNTNIYFGSSICIQKQFDRLTVFDCSEFYSIEPILGPITLTFSRFVKWVIIGAETGNRKEKVIPHIKWVQDIVDQCKAANVPVFLKSSLAEIWGEPLIQEFPW